jgi:DNA end-binding protein Ku
MPQLRSIWKGHIRFSLVTIPIRIYNAVDTAQSVRFNQIHRDCNGRIGYDKRCKKCEKQVTQEDILKGYQYEPDQYVIFEKDDLDKLKLKSTKVIDIEGFVDSAEVHPTLFDSPYYAGPDGEVAAKTYSLLVAALRDSGKLGVGKVVLREREDVVMIAPHGDGILLYKLRYPKEIREIDNVPLVEKSKTNKEELKLAKSLIDSMTTSFDKLELENKYANAVMDMVQAKIDGKEIVAMEEEEKEVVDIMSALKQSIEQAKGSKKPMTKVKQTAAAAKKKSKNKSKTKTKAKAKKKTKAKGTSRKRKTA